MLTAIRQWVIKTMMKGQTGVVQTMPKQQMIEMNVQITAERFMRNGINPEDMKTVGQVENVINQLETPKVNVNPGVTGVKKADVMDMEGNKIDTSKGIMGGKEVPTSIDQENFLQRVKRAVDENRKSDAAIDLDKTNRTVDDLGGDKTDPFSKNFDFENEVKLQTELALKKESDAAIKARLDASNKKGIAGIKINLVDDSIAKIKSMEPMDAMKEANLVAGKKGRYANLDDNQVKKIMDDTQEHIFQDSSPLDDYAIGGRVGLKEGDHVREQKRTVAPSDATFVPTVPSSYYSKPMPSSPKTPTVENSAGITSTTAIASPRFFGSIFDFQKKKDEEETESLADGGRAGYKFGLGPLFNFLNKKSPAKAYTDYLKSIKDRVKAGKEAEVAGEVIPIAAGGALITNQVKKKLKAMNEEQKKKIKQEMENTEKKADGGRIGLKAGMTKRAFLKLMGSVGLGVGAAKSGLFSLGKGAGKTVAKEVAQQTTSSMPPPYFFKLAEKIKKMGKDVTSTSERTVSKSLKSKDGTADYVLEEDMVTGDVQIKKINMENDNMINDIEIMEYRTGENVMTKDGKVVTTPHEYDEVTESYSRIYKDDYNAPDYQDGIRVDEIIKEVDDTTPSIKYASGGLAYMLGE